MIRMRFGAAALATVLLGGCMDFVEPDVLGLARPTRLQVSIDLVNSLAGACGAFVDAPGEGGEAGPAELCLVATLEPGTTRLGEQRAVTDSVLTLFGSPIWPEAQPNGNLVYRSDIRLPAGALGDTVFHLVFPRVEGVEIQPAEMRWLAVGQVTGDTVRRKQGEPLRIVLDVPESEPVPRPSQQDWDFVVLGDTALVSLRGSGFPNPVYRVPPELLDEFTGEPKRATLRFTQRLFRQSGDALVGLELVERLAWAIHEPDAPAGAED